MNLGRVEVLCGVLSGVLGLAALGFSLFAPLGTVCIDTVVPSSDGGCFPISLVQAQGVESLTPVIALFGTLSLGVIIFSVGHSLSHIPALLVLLWVNSAFLYFSTVIALLSVGLFFIPADLLALVASIVGTVAAQRSVPVRA